MSLNKSWFEGLTCMKSDEPAHQKWKLGGVCRRAKARLMLLAALIMYMSAECKKKENRLYVQTERPQRILFIFAIDPFLYLMSKTAKNALPRAQNGVFGFNRWLSTQWLFIYLQTNKAKLKLSHYRSLCCLTRVLVWHVCLKKRLLNFEFLISCKQPLLLLKQKYFHLYH